MKPREVFGIIVRTIGLMLLLYGVYSVWSLLFVATPTPVPIPNRLGLFILGALSIVPYFVVGFILTRKAEWIVNFCYPNPVQRHDNSSAHPASEQQDPRSKTRSKAKVDKWYEPFEEESAVEDSDDGQAASNKGF